MAVYSEYDIQNIVRNPQFKQLMKDIFDITTGHDHDGVNTKAVSVGTVADSAITNAKVNASAAIDVSKLANGSVSNTEFQYLDGVTSNIQDQIDGFSAGDLANGTPVNAVGSTGTLTLSGVVLDAETVTIGSDVYELAADAAQTVTGSNIAVDITSYTTASQGTLTVDTQPTALDTMTIGTKVYTFVADGSENADGLISVGTDLASAQANIVAAINGSDGVNDAHPSVSAAAFATNASVITALVGGVAGDSIATTESFTAGSNVFDAATLGTTTGGADCTAANGVTAIVAAITASDTEGFGAVDGAGDTVVITADTFGTAKNGTTTTTDIGNGAWGAGTTASGVDGTVGRAGQEYYDASYHYVCVATNTIADANWRRISLGSAY